MLRNLSRALLAFIAIAFGSIVRSQPIVDITVVPGQNNDLEVRIRPTTDFDGVCSSIVFAIRWSNASGASLGAVQQTIEQHDVLDITAVGSEQVDGPYRYQIYFGLSLIPLSDIPFVLLGGQEYTLFTVPVVNAQDVFSIVNDDWTEANNADYYISLNGVDSTGDIYGISTSTGPTIGADGSFSAWPNPAVNNATITMRAAKAGMADLRLIDASGKVVWSERTSVTTGPTTRDLDLRGVAPGAYLLRGELPDGTRTVQLIKR